MHPGVVQAKELAALLGRYDLRGHVNLIPWNPVADSAFQRPAPRAVKAFSQARAAGLMHAACAMPVQLHP